MNKISIIALAVMAGALFNATEAAAKKKKDKDAKKAKTEVVELKTTADSISYAAGKVRTNGLHTYLKQSMGVDTAYMADFIRGYEDAMARGFDERSKAYMAGGQIAQMVSQRMLPFLKDEFANMTDTLTDNVFNAGFVAALAKEEGLMADSVAKTYFDAAFKRAIEERNAAAKKEGADFLAANGQKDSVVTLPDGLQYKVLTQGDGIVADKDDEVVVKYEGRLIDGTVFDSSYGKGDETAKFRPNQVIKGWTEALTMMPAGSKWELYIPYDLAYGERGSGKIKPFSTLIFTVEVVSVNKKDSASPAAKNERPAKRMPIRVMPNK